MKSSWKIKCPEYESQSRKYRNIFNLCKTWNIVNKTEHKSERPTIMTLNPRGGAIKNHSSRKRERKKTTRQWYLPYICRLTFINEAKFILSCGGPPRVAGYSQSMSSPSKFLFRKNSIVEFINIDLLLGWEAISLKGLLPKFQPPTASNVFNDGFDSFKLLNRSYLKCK